MKKKIAILALFFILIFGPILAHAASDQDSRYLEIITKIDALLQELREIIKSNISNQPTCITTPVTIQPVGEEEVILNLNSPVVNKAIEMELNLVEVGDNYADIEINYFDRASYQGVVTTGNPTGWVPNPNLYPEYYSGSDLLSAAKRVYRTHKWCDGRMKDDLWKGGYQIIELEGYSNYLCRNRFKEQCISDGTYDNYYDERCDFGRTRFNLNETKSSSDFSITLESILGNSQVKIKITDKDTTAIINPTKVELMKVKGESGIYAVDKNRNIKMPILDSSILDSYGLKNTKPKEVEAKVIKQYTTSDPVGLNEDSLVKTNSKATVYVIQNGELKPVASPSALKKNGYDWKNLKIVSDKVIDLYQLGETLK